VSTEKWGENEQKARTYIVAKDIFISPIIYELILQYFLSF